MGPARADATYVIDIADGGAKLRVFVPRGAGQASGCRPVHCGSKHLATRRWRGSTCRQSHHSFGALIARHTICVEGVKAALGGFTRRAVALRWKSP
jgi:hypothetical protein